MEKIKLNCIIYFIVVVSSIVLLISVYKTEKKYEENLMLVVNNKIKEAAKDCYINNDCSGKIKLEDLYKKEYLKEVVNPITKEIMDKNICLKQVDEEIEFCK